MNSGTLNFLGMTTLGTKHISIAFIWSCREEFIAQPKPMLLNPHNLGANEVSQHAMYSQFAQPVYPIKISSIIDLTIKKFQKNNMLKEDGLNKWVALEQRLRAFKVLNISGVCGCNTK